MRIIDLLNELTNYKETTLKEIIEDDGMMGDEASLLWNTERYNTLTEFIEKYKSGYMTNAPIENFIFIIRANNELKEYEPIILDIIKVISYKLQIKIKEIMEIKDPIDKLCKSMEYK